MSTITPTGGNAAAPVEIRHEKKSTKLLPLELCVGIGIILICLFFMFKWNKVPTRYTEVQTSYVGPVCKQYVGVKIVRDHSKYLNVSHDVIGLQVKPYSQYNSNPGTYVGLMNVNVRNNQTPLFADTILPKGNSFHPFEGERLRNTIFCQARQVANELLQNNAPFELDDVSIISRLMVVTSNGNKLFGKSGAYVDIDTNLIHGDNSIRHGSNYNGDYEYEIHQTYIIRNDTIVTVSDTLNRRKKFGIGHDGFTDLFLDQYSQYPERELMNLFVTEETFGDYMDRNPQFKHDSIPIVNKKNYTLGGGFSVCSTKDTIVKNYSAIQTDDHRKPHSIFTMEDVSRLNEVVRFEDGGNLYPLNVKKLEFDYQAPIDNFTCYPRPDVFTGSGFIFTDSEKLKFIRDNGLCVSVHFPEWDNTQNKRFWIITLIITIIATYLLKRLWEDLFFDKIEKKPKVIKIGAISIAVLVIAVLLCLGISTNSQYNDPQKNPIQYFDGRIQAKPITCPICNGSGKVKCICEGAKPNCKSCQGTGVRDCYHCYGKKEVTKERYW